ncbi:MAG: type II toxin-antitoxin system RelE/ParE family toxin [Alphaproteobacteria bacterium]
MRIVRLRPGARADLRKIWRFSKERWDEHQADKYIRDLHAKFAQAAANDALGAPCDDLRPGYLRIKAGSHVIFFKRTADLIVVVRVLHQSMDFQRHL